MKKLTEQQEKELQELLIADILERYNHPEYHDRFIIEDFYENLENEKDLCDRCKKCGENTCGNDTLNHKCFEGM